MLIWWALEIDLYVRNYPCNFQIWSPLASVSETHHSFCTSTTHIVKLCHVHLKWSNTFWGVGTNQVLYLLPRNVSLISFFTPHKPPFWNSRLQGTVSFYTANYGLHMVEFWNSDVAREEWDNNWLCKSSEEIRGHFLMTREFSFMYYMKITSFMLCLN